MKRSAAEILREYGPFPGVEGVHGVTFDGQHGFALHEGEEIAVTRAKSIRLVRATNRNYFEVLRKKLKWGER